MFSLSKLVLPFLQSLWFSVLLSTPVYVRVLMPLCCVYRQAKCYTQRTNIGWRRITSVTLRCFAALQSSRPFCIRVKGEEEESRQSVFTDLYTWCEDSLIGSYMPASPVVVVWKESKCHPTSASRYTSASLVSCGLAVKRKSCTCDERTNERTKNCVGTSKKQNKKIDGRLQEVELRLLASSFIYRNRVINCLLQTNLFD